MSWPYDQAFAQQGWQCPCCNCVYSPSTPMCFSCGGNNRAVTTSGTAAPLPIKTETISDN